MKSIGIFMSPCENCQGLSRSKTTHGGVVLLELWFFIILKVIVVVVWGGEGLHFFQL